MTTPQGKHLGKVEFIALMAMMFATIAFSIDAMMPALPDISADIAPYGVAQAALVMTFFVIGMGAGVIYSTLGGTHHTMEDIAVASAIPNMTVLAPCDPEEMRLATTWCATESTGPVYMRLGKAGEPDLTSDAVDPFEIGKIRYLVRGDGDLCILTYGITMKMAFDIADRVREKTGKQPSIVSVHTIKPLDEAGILGVLNSHERTAVIEEHVPHGGLASRVKELAWDNGVTKGLKSFTLKDEFIHFYGSYEELLERHGLEAGAIATALT